METVLTHLQAPEKIANFTNYDVKSKDGYDMILNLSVTLNSILHRHFSLTYFYGVACLLETPPFWRKVLGEYGCCFR